MRCKKPQRWGIRLIKKQQNIIWMCNLLMWKLLIQESKISIGYFLQKEIFNIKNKCKGNSNHSNSWFLRTFENSYRQMQGLPNQFVTNNQRQYRGFSLTGTPARTYNSGVPIIHHLKEALDIKSFLQISLNKQMYYSRDHMNCIKVLQEYKIQRLRIRKFIKDQKFNLKLQLLNKIRSNKFQKQIYQSQ
ncbi:unnamed protein product [Paramecium sonneborni]|uniref:Uncharacterized protein n=1 Tax=Paramecium sonneborni TaxID=65129 RepID=A0A8S1JSH7_9CILI|nr:unnamed protein product [Paramecium sonneborni]